MNEENYLIQLDKENNENIKLFKQKLECLKRQINVKCAETSTAIIPDYTYFDKKYNSHSTTTVITPISQSPSSNSSFASAMSNNNDSIENIVLDRRSKSSGESSKKYTQKYMSPQTPSSSSSIYENPIPKDAVNLSMGLLKTDYTLPSSMNSISSASYKSISSIGSSVSVSSSSSIEEPTIITNELLPSTSRSQFQNVINENIASKSNIEKVLQPNVFNFINTFKGNTEGEPSRPTEKMVSKETSTKAKQLNESSASSNQKSDLRSQRLQKNAQQKSNAVSSSGNNGKVNDKLIELNPTNLLLMELLTRNSKQRNDYIMQMSVNHNLVMFNDVSCKYEWSEFIRNTNHIKSNSKTIRKPIVQGINLTYDSVFECEINTLVQHYLDPTLANQYVLEKFSRTIENENAFDLNENVLALKTFVQKLIDINCGSIITGFIRINANNNWDSYITNSRSSNDVLINSVILRKCAMNGDLVSVFVFNQSEHQLNENSNNLNNTIDEYITNDHYEDDLTNGNNNRNNNNNNAVRYSHGFVIEILRKVCSRQVVCQLNYHLAKKEKRNTGNGNPFIKFSPRDNRIPFIYVNKNDISECVSDRVKTEAVYELLLLIEIYKWIDDVPYGKFVREIGWIGELIAEYETILHNNACKINKFPDEIIRAIPEPDNYHIPSIEYSNKKRVNLTTACIFTIDPTDAKDLDDAVSCSTLANGNFEIGVHISDVTYYIEEHSPLDNLVLEQTTSIYSTNKVYHMLPESLCKLCSLLPGEDKLTVSIFFEITENGDIVNYRIVRSIINSCAKLSYDIVQKIIEKRLYAENSNNDNHNSNNNDNLPTIFNNYTIDNVSMAINQLYKMSTILRRKRFENGAIRFDRAKIHFQLHSVTGQPISFEREILRESNRLIEEFMILANEKIATVIHNAHSNIAILRYHDPPISRLVRKTMEQCDLLKIPIDRSTLINGYKSLMHYIDGYNELSGKRCVLNDIIIKPFKKANYVCTNEKEDKELYHFALGIPKYTHFTSPIRRYPDILVHRLLLATLDCAPLPKRTPDELVTIASTCNEHKHNAKAAQEDLQLLYFVRYVKNLNGVKMKGVVSNIFEYSIEIILIDSGYRIKIQNSDLLSHNIFMVTSNTEPRTAEVFRKRYGKNRNNIKLEIFTEIIVLVYEQRDNLKAKFLFDN